MKSLSELTKEYYDKFVGLPSNSPIVRQNQLNDAFEIVVLETLYGKEKDIDVAKMTASDIDVLSSYIVAPPDSGIDIVVEHEDIDGNRYDFIQVKNSALTPLQMEQTLDYMDKSIKKYMKKPQDVSENLRIVLANTNLSAADKSNCKFILVHTGIDNYYKGQKEDKYQVITETELNVIRNAANADIPRVSLESFKSDSFNNFIIYEEAEEPAILMNLRGYDLAELAIKYTNTSMGRNILFGQNLRESLSNSKTYDGMAKTICEEPEKFWFYNNGITIIADDFDTVKAIDEKTVDKITLKDFSIINGAQTTSALGRFLKEARMNNATEEENKLKNVFVLTRILKVTDPEFKSRISIFNNTQNPITTRDMASNREEQLQLFNRLVKGDNPHIYMEIRRGMSAPNDVKFLKHQYTTNEELAQLAYAGFKRDPFTAKDKKKSLFDTDYKQQDYLLNKYYHDIFHFDYDSPEGILFQKGKEDIDELLFAYYLYKESKKILIRKYKEKIEEFQDKLNKANNNDEKQNHESRIAYYEKLKAICNICSFYCLAYYYSFKNEFSSVDEGKVYKYNDFYSDTQLRNALIEGFRDLFLTPTIEVIKELTVNNPNLNTWIRDKKSTPLFIEKVDDEFGVKMNLETEYTKYINDFKK